MTECELKSSTGKIVHVRNKRNGDEWEAVLKGRSSIDGCWQVSGPDGKSVAVKGERILGLKAMGEAPATPAATTEKKPDATWLLQRTGSEEDCSTASGVLSEGLSVQQGMFGNPNTATTETVNSEIATPSDNLPDETWPVEQLLAYGQGALRGGEDCDMGVIALARRAVSFKFNAGRAYSILRSRLKPLGKWCECLKAHDLPRTSVWEVVEAYELATTDGYNEENIADKYGTWTAVLVAYGLAKDKKNAGAGAVERLEPPADDDNAPDDSDQQRPAVAGKIGGTSSSGDQDTDDEAGNDQEPTREPQPPLTAAELDLLTKFVEAVGGITRAEHVFQEGIKQIREHQG